jgi:hypothetical protein
MVEPIDIWRAARLMVKEHGPMAPLECAMKADERSDDGDADGEKVWLAIRRAAKSLLENGAPTDIERKPAE